MRIHAHRQGFTLLEVIAAIMLTALAMIAVFPFLDRVFQLAHEPATTLQEAFSLQTAMEHLVEWDTAHTNDPELLHQHLQADSHFMGQRVVSNLFVEFTPGGQLNTAPATNYLLLVGLQSTSTFETVVRLFAPPP